MATGEAKIEQTDAGAEVAAKHGASVSEETDAGREAYRDWPRDFEQVRATWPL